MKELVFNQPKHMKSQRVTGAIHTETSERVPEKKETNKRQVDTTDGESRQRWTLEAKPGVRRVGKEDQ